MQARPESELAKIVIAWLVDQRWEVFQEVQLHYADRIADIIATQDKLIWSIEVKRSLGLRLVDQAWHWRWHVHYSSIAVPYSCINRRSPRIVHKILTDLGIGLLLIHKDYIEESIAPRINRPRDADTLRIGLTPEHKTFAQAGNVLGKRWTPFQATTRQVRKVVAESPGLSLKEMIDRIEHHYASSATARSCLAKWIRRGIIEGVEARREGKRVRLYLSDLED